MRVSMNQSPMRFQMRSHEMKRVTSSEWVLERASGSVDTRRSKWILISSLNIGSLTICDVGVVSLCPVWLMIESV